jgi:hypothetical protein
VYSLLINRLSPHSIPVPFRFCINLIQFTRSNSSCHSVKHVHNSSSAPELCSDIILRIPDGSLVPFPLLNPKWSSQSTSAIFLSILLLSILATIFAVCGMILTVQWPSCLIEGLLYVSVSAYMTP